MISGKIYGKIKQEIPDRVEMILTIFMQPALVMTTPFSREKYEDTYKIDALEIMSPMNRIIKHCDFWQGHGFRTNGNKVGWRHNIQGREKKRKTVTFPDWNVAVLLVWKNYFIV